VYCERGYLMYRQRLKGSYYEMGRRYGSILSTAGFAVPRMPRGRLALGLECRNEVERFFPEILEELRGIADECSLEADRFTSWMLTLGLDASLCTCFVIGDGRDILLGRNHDWLYTSRDTAESYLTMPDDGYWSLAHTDVFVGRADGMNEEGLAIGMARVPGLVVSAASTS